MKGMGVVMTKKGKLGNEITMPESKDKESLGNLKYKSGNQRETGKGGRYQKYSPGRSRKYT